MLLHLQANVGFIQLFVLQVVQDRKTQVNELKSAFLFAPYQNTAAYETNPQKQAPIKEVMIMKPKHNKMTQVNQH